MSFSNFIYNIEKLSVAFLLRFINAKKAMGKRLFRSIARVTVSVAIEAVCVRNGENGQKEIFLVKRAKSDPYYSGQWYCPGSVMRSGEKIADVFKRLEKNREIGAKVSKYNFINICNGPDHGKIVGRGHFISLVYLCSLGSTPKHGKWWSVDNLPENIIAGHRDYIIPIALEK